MLILKKILILILIFFPFVLKSQTKEIDNIRNKIETTTIDSSKINSLNLLGEKLLRYNLDNAMDTLNLSVKLARNVHFYKGLAKAFKIKGFVFYHKGKIDSSLQCFTTGKTIYEENGFLVDAGKMANNIGIVKGKLGDLTGAIKSYLEAIELLKRANEYRPLITTYINASNTYRNIGNYQEALNLNFQALETFKNLTDISQDDSLSIGHIYKSIANIYTSQKSYKKAELSYLKALKIYEKYESMNDVGDIYLNIGFLYGSNDNDSKNDTIIKLKKHLNFQTFVYHFLNKDERKNDTIAERENYLKALQYYTIKDKIALANLNLGDSYKKSEMYDSSHYHLNIALEIYSELGDKRGIILVYNSFGEYYNKTGKYSEAIKVLKTALDTAKHIGDIKIISSLSNSLYDSYKSTGNYKDALAMHELYKQMQDSIFNTNNEKKLTQMSLSFEFEKEKEQTQIKYNEEIKRQRIIKYFTFAVLFLMVLGLLAVFSAFKTKKKKNEELNIKNAEITQQKEEIEAQRDEIETQLVQIERQKDQLEIKNRDIEASIHYALRIQKAILPKLSILNKYFSDNFVYNKPRDIVSGDFYWATEKQNKLFVVAADCTGHGVPGAFM
ncbi:MAG: tetratricopeptide repeat protein, partial [Bacteroidota bacterium]|nr:tetratricopeptide repeat protein [Bacteroidota bacterium]